MVLTPGRGPEPSGGHENAVSDSEGQGGRGFAFPGEAAAANLGLGSVADPVGVAWSEGLWVPPTPDGESLSLCCQPPSCPRGNQVSLGSFRRLPLRPDLGGLLKFTPAVGRHNWGGIFRPCIANLFPLLKGADPSPPLPAPRGAVTFGTTVACASRFQPQTWRPGGLSPAAPGREAEATPAAPGGQGSRGSGWVRRRLPQLP